MARLDHRWPQHHPGALGRSISRLTYRLPMLSPETGKFSCGAFSLKAESPHSTFKASVG